MRKGPYIFWTLLLAALFFRFAQSQQASAPQAFDCLRKNVTGTGMIASDPERKETGQTFVIHAPSLISDGGIRCADALNIRVKTKLYPVFIYGESITFQGKLSAPYNFMSDNGRSFDYKGYLAKDEIYYEIKSAKVIPADMESEKDIYSFLYGIKHRFVSNIEKVLGEPHSALAAGLVVGEKSSLGSELIDAFRKVGLIHVVVLSGFNITIVAVALRRMLSFLPRVWGIVIGGIGIILFGILVGGGATVVRSCLMASIVLIADLIRRDYNVYTALGFAAAVMLIQNPSILLHDPSFQLSFLATLGLVILAKPFEEKLKFIPERFGLRGTVATTFATQVFVSPYILYMMGQISVIGFAANILVLPFIPITMLAVFLAGALGFIFSPLSMVAGWASHIMLSYELFVVEKFAALPFASAELPPFSFLWVAAFYISLAFALILLNFRRKIKTKPA